MLAPPAAPTQHCTIGRGRLLFDAGEELGQRFAVSDELGHYFASSNHALARNGFSAHTMPSESFSMM
jgi:hypothetical protein